MKIVHKVELGMDRKEILATTYQMRNFYAQMRDGYFDTLDIMNYIQHHQIVKWAKKGDKILDVCCGRGLLLPMLRYYKKDVASYTGVDIESKNVSFTTKRVTDNKPIEPDYYPFPVEFFHSNVAQMSEILPDKYDLVIYTSSIEHMHHDMGLQSLFECRKVSKAKLIITCPNTPENQNGYDTQYAAHVYEWKRSELIKGLEQAGFRILDEWGLLVPAKVLKEKCEIYNQLKKFIPAEWLIPVLSPLFPELSEEIGFICEVKNELSS